MSETLERDALDIAVRPLEHLLAFGEDVAVNRPGEAWHYVGGAWERHAVPALTEARLRGIAILAEAQHRPELRQPIISTDVPSGHRLEALLPPAVLPGTAALSFRRADEDVSPVGDIRVRYDVSRWNAWDARKARQRAAEDALLALYDAGDIEGFLAAFAARRMTPLFCGATGAGKAQPLTAKILTPTGFKDMGALRVGDLVTCPDGKLAPITAIYPQGEKDIFRVTFEDGRTVECCDDHLWKVWEHRVRFETGKSHATRKAISGGEWSVVPLSKIRGWMDRRTPKGKRVGVPLVNSLCVEFPAADLPIAPYALGAILGDGCTRANYVSLSTLDSHIIDRVMCDLPAYKAVPLGEVSFRLRQKVRQNPSPITQKLRALGVHGLMAHEKFVPPIYKMGSVEQRLALIQGLMDTDGTAGPDGTGAMFCSTSERLARDVQEIAWSLGAIAKIHIVHPTYKGKDGELRNGRTAYQVYMVHPNIGSFFSLPRKVVKCRAASREHRLRIVSIEPIGRAPAQCIAVGHPDHLYITNSYVVTHNTYLLKSYLTLLPMEARVLVIEDAKEAVLRQPNHLRLIFKRNGITPLDLLTTSLRLRPDYVALQELRNGEAAWVYLNECMAGHPGSPTTIHGATPEEAATRLFNMIKGTDEGRGIESETLIQMMETAIDMIVPIENNRGVRAIGEIWFAPAAARRGERLADLIRKD